MPTTVNTLNLGVNLELFGKEISFSPTDITKITPNDLKFEYDPTKESTPLSLDAADVEKALSVYGINTPEFISTMLDKVTLTPGYMMVKGDGTYNLEIDIGPKVPTVSPWQPLPFIPLSFNVKKVTFAVKSPAPASPGT